MKICPAYVSKTHSNCEKQINLLKIPSKEKEGWHYLAVKKLSGLVREITLKANGDFYCLNCFYLFKTKNELGCHERVCKNKYFVELLCKLKKIIY